MRINFVMSNEVYSGIFDAIINYFREYLPQDCELYVTKYPLDNMDIYHYHRPNLEKNLRENSVVTIHHDLEDTDPWFQANEFIDKYHQADKIICLNSLQKKYLLEKEELNNTVIIPHGIDKRIFSPRVLQKVEDRKYNFAIVSKRYGRRVKGEALMHELYKRLDTSKICFHFLGTDRTIDQEEVENLGFEAYSYEYLPYNMYNKFYENIDFLLIPSLYEGGPANLPEAIYQRIPILGRKIAMIEDYLIEGTNGFFLTGIPHIDSELIERIINDKDNLYSKMIEKINTYELKVLDWEIIVKEHVTLYKTIVNSKDSNND